MATDYNFPTDGITAKTPKNIMFGACTVHANLEYDNERKCFNGKESILCATSGGATFKVEPEFLDVEVDGAYVQVAELKQKVGEKVTLEVNAAEVSDKVVNMAAIGERGDDLPNYHHIKAKDLLESKDYIHNLGVVGTRMDGTPLVIIIPRALCTSGLELASENKKAAAPKLTFTGMSTLEDSKRSVGWHIYYPKDIDADGYINYNTDYGNVKEFVYDTALYSGKNVNLRAPKVTETADNFLIQGWTAKLVATGGKWSFLPFNHSVASNDFLNTGASQLQKQLSFYCSKVNKITFLSGDADGGLPPNDLELTIGSNFAGIDGASTTLDSTKKEGSLVPARENDEWTATSLNGNPRGLHKQGYTLTGWEDQDGEDWDLDEALSGKTKGDYILSPVWTALSDLMEKGEKHVKGKTSIQNDKNSK